MNTFMRRSVLSLSLVVVAASGVACGGTSSAETPSTAQSAVTTTGPLAVNTHGHTRVVSEALSEVALRPDQRTQLEQLATTAETRHAAIQAAHKDLMSAIADQVESGTIDRTALQPKIDAAVAAMNASRPADRAAFEQVHAILDSTQRAQFVDALRAKAKERFADRKPGMGSGGHGGHLAKIADDLQLTEAQRDQVKTLLKGEWQHGDHPMHDGKERGEKVLDAFKGDRFVFDEVAPPVNIADKADHMTTRLIDVTEKVMPILTADQRKLAAAKFRERAADPKEGAPLGEPAPF